MYFLRGSLPWQGLKVDKKEYRYKKIYEKKKSTTAEELCKGYAKEFCQYINYTRNLTFEQEPDYNHLRGLLKQVISDNHSNPELIEFDWELKRGSIEKNLNKVVSNVTYTNNLINKENNLINKTQYKTITLKQNGNKTRINSKNIQLPSINQIKPSLAGKLSTQKKKDSFIDNVIKENLL